jgi:hypothetical protein
MRGMAPALGRDAALSAARHAARVAGRSRAASPLTLWCRGLLLGSQISHLPGQARCVELLVAFPRWSTSV